MFSLQIQCICALFVKERLKREGLLSRKVSSTLETPTNAQARQAQSILIILNRMSYELERLHPRTFSNISIPVPEVAPMIIETVGKTLFKHNDITWGKVISFMSISSALAVDCVKVGQPEVVQLIVDSSAAIISDEAALWIEKEGGWSALSEHIRPMGSEHITFLGFLTVSVGFLLTIHWSWILFKSISKQISNLL